jgi:two-component sensor histidine kinase
MIETEKDKPQAGENLLTGVAGHSLALLITLPFLFLFLMFVSLLFLICSSNSWTAARANGLKQIDEMQNQVESYLEVYFHDPLFVVSTDAKLINAGIIDARDFDAVSHLLVSQIRGAPCLTLLSMRFHDGQYVCVTRPLDGSALSVNEDRRKKGMILDRSLLEGVNASGILPEERAAFDAETLPRFKSLPAGDEAIWYPTYKDPSHKNMGAGVALPVYRKDGSLAGILAGAVCLRKLTEHLQGMLPPQMGVGFVADREGWLLAGSSSSPAIFEGMSLLKPDPAEDPVLREAAKSLASMPERIGSLRFRLGAESYIGDYRNIEPEPGLRLGVGIVLPESSFAKSLLGNTRTTLILMLLAMSLVCVLGILLARDIVRPVRSIQNRAMRLARGDWIGETAQPGQARELVTLAGAFETMASSLRQTLDGLEDTVAKRTAELRSLVREVLHRSKNNFTIMASMLSLQASEAASADTATALNEAKERIMSMALLYDRLYQAPDIRSTSCVDYLGVVIDNLREAFISGERIRIDTEIDTVSLDPNKAANLGIIVTELVTNAVKYAFPAEGHGGVIKVSARVLDKRLMVRISDDGRGLPDTFEMERDGGFGLTLVSALCRQCGGKLSLGRGPRSGAEFQTSLNIIV